LTLLTLLTVRTVSNKLDDIAHGRPCTGARSTTYYTHLWPCVRTVNNTVHSAKLRLWTTLRPTAINSTPSIGLLYHSPLIAFSPAGQWSCK